MPNMIKDNLKIDFKKKKIFCNPKGSVKMYTVQEIYSLIQDIFDEPENMKYEIPIVAKSKTKYSLINGWTIDNESLKHLKGSISS